MTSIRYSEVFASYYVKVEAYDLFEADMSDETRNALLCSYLHSACSEPYIRRLFSSFKIYDDPAKVVEEDTTDEDTTTTETGSKVINNGKSTSSTDTGETTPTGGTSGDTSDTDISGNTGKSTDKSEDITAPSESENTQEKDTDGIIKFEMANPSNDDTEDKDFVVEVLSWGMVYYWCSKYVYTPTEMAQMIGTSSSKFYSQSQHVSELRGLREDAHNFQRSLIRDRGYVKNDWISGKITARKQSSSSTTT